MYKNQLQELAQRSCFNLPSYTCIREGPDHAPRFKASVNFNGEIFQGPDHCTTLRQAEHAAAEVALNILSARVPSRILAARVLDEIGVYKNLLQESVHKAGLTLPVYSTERSGPGHLPVFVSIVELAGMNFTGEAARTKKQSEKNAAMAAWSALKQLSNDSSEEQEHLLVARVLSKFKPKGENKAVRVRPSVRSQHERSKTVSSCRESQSGPSTKELLHHHQWKPTRLLSDFSSSLANNQQKCSFLPPTSSTISPPLEEHQKDEDEWLNGGITDKREESIEFNIPIHRRLNSTMPSHICQNTESLLIRTAPHGRNGGIAPAVHIRSVIPVCAAPPRRGPSSNSPIPQPQLHGRNGGIAPAVHIRSVIPVCAAPPRRPPSSNSSIPQAQLQKKQEDHSSVLDSSVIKETEQEIPAASSKLDNLHL